MFQTTNQLSNIPHSFLEFPPSHESCGIYQQGLLEDGQSPVVTTMGSILKWPCDFFFHIPFKETSISNIRQSHPHFVHVHPISGLQIFDGLGESALNFDKWRTTSAWPRPLDPTPCLSVSMACGLECRCGRDALRVAMVLTYQSPADLSA